MVVNKEKRNYRHWFNARVVDGFGITRMVRQKRQKLIPL